MAKDQVNIVFSADSRQMQAAYAEMARGNDKVATTTEKAAGRMQSFGNQLDSITGKYTKLAGVVAAATNAIMRHNEELERSADRSRSLEDIIGRVATQAGMPRGGEAVLTRKIGGIASRNAATMEQTAGAVEQLISSGFSAGNVLEGGVADVFLQSLHALNASGRDQDPKELARAMSRFLKGTGQNLDARSLQGLAVPLFNLFQNTDVQAADLSFLGAKASPLTQLGRMSPNEILAAFSVIKDVKGASEASTSFGSLVARLAGGSGDTGVTNALSKLGLAPGDVDFVGENFLTVLSRLQGGVSRLPESQRAGVLKQLAGQENLDTLTTFLGSIDTIRQRQGGLSATDIYGEAAMRRMSGLGARERRLDVRRALNTIEEGEIERAHKIFRQESLEEFREQYGSGAAGILGRVHGALDWWRAIRPMPEAHRIRQEEIAIKLPNQVRVPGTRKATEHLSKQ